MIQKGDHVKIVGTVIPSSYGIVIGPWNTVPEWWEIFSCGEIIHWPGSQLEVVNESR